MNENQTKLDLLRKEIESCSEKEAAAIVSEAEKQAEDSINALTNELSGKHSSKVRKITDDFRNSEKKRVSEVCFTEGRRVLMHRTALVEEFFGKVRERLVSLTETPRYTAYLKGCIEKANDYSPICEGVTIFCRTCDTALVDGLLKEYNCSLKADDGIEIGGILVRYEEKGILTDLTIESALENEREKFTALKEMQI